MAGKNFIRKMSATFTGRVCKNLMAKVWSIFYFLLTDLAIFVNILSLANLAHLVEQLPRNEQVLGSSPGVG